MVDLHPIEKPGKAGSVAPILKDLICKMNRWEFKWQEIFKWIQGKRDIASHHNDFSSV